MGPCNLKPELSSALSHHRHLHTAQPRDKTTLCRLPGHAHCLGTWLLPRNPSKIRMASEFECQRKQWNYPPLKTYNLRVPGFPRHEAQSGPKTTTASPPPDHTNPVSTVDNSRELQPDPHIKLVLVHDTCRSGHADCSRMQRKGKKTLLEASAPRGAPVTMPESPRDHCGYLTWTSSSVTAATDERSDELRQGGVRWVGGQGKHHNFLDLGHTGRGDPPGGSASQTASRDRPATPQREL